MGNSDLSNNLNGDSYLSQQIAKLSPAKRALLEIKLKQLEQVKDEQSYPVEEDNLTKITPISRNQPLQLSFGQQRLWFLEQLEGESNKYNIFQAFKLTGNLNITALEKAFQSLVDRHEILRSCFQSNQGYPLQVITPQLEIKILIIDLQGISQDYQEREIKSLISVESQRHFDLTQVPLIRLNLIRLKEQSHLLFLTVHHIIFDGWSTEILIEEISVLYQAYIENRPNPLPNLAIQYADFAHWQRQWLQGVILEKQLSYWRQNLHNSPPLINLPTDRPRPNQNTYGGKSQSFFLNSSLSQALKNFSRKSSVTLFISLFTAFAILLFRYTFQKDIVIASLIANRTRKEIDALIGFFVNTLALRINITDEATFLDLLSQVRQIVLNAHLHQDLPFEKLVEELKLERSLSYHPLFQVMFVLHNHVVSDWKLPHLTVSNIEIPSQTSIFDLLLEIKEIDGQLLGIWTYNTDLFDDHRMERMTGHFQTLLEGIIENPQQLITKLPLLPVSEKNQLLVAWNNTKVEYPNQQCIHQLFEEQVEKTPENIAVVFEAEELTYKELNNRANQLAHYLQKLGVKAEVLVGICVERSLDMIVGLLGILKAGGAYVPLDPNYPPERLSYMLNDSQIKILLTQSQLGKLLPKSLESLIYLDTDWRVFSQENQDNLCTVGNTNNLAYLLYTSGSTGQPKGVQICHYSLSNLLNSLKNSLEVNHDETFLAITTISFDIAALELYLPLIVGGKLIIANRETARDGNQLLAELTKSKATIMQATPTTWQMLIDCGFSSNYQLKVLCGGEALPRKLSQQLLATGNQVWNLYGPTETTIWSTFYKVETATQGNIALIGKAISNTEIYILDAYLQPVPVGLSGELHIGGKGIARGYLNRPELTAAKFIPNPFSSDANSSLYKTSDLARYLPDGNIEYVGRIDNQVKIRGFRIELAEIEVVLSEHPDVLNAVVICREDHPGNKRLIAYIIPQYSKILTFTELRQFLQQKLPDYIIPAAFVILESFPLTPNGKIDLNALPSANQSILEMERIFVYPQDKLEYQLTQMWENILGITPIGTNDNFFLMGGHSLLAVRLFTQIEQKFFTKIPLSVIFQAPTIEQLAKVLRSQIKLPSWYSLVPLQPKGNRPILFAIHAFLFNNLSRHLGEEQPIYGLHYGMAEPMDSVLYLPKMEDLAAHYIEEMRSLQPKGPYFLMGLSLTGVIAYEMAQQLVAQGEKVALLALFDSYIEPPKANLLPVSQQLFRLWRLGFKELVKKVQKQLKIKSAQIRSQYFSPTNTTEALELRYFPHNHTRQPLNWLRNNYTPKPYSGRVDFFKAMKDSSPAIFYSFDPPEVAWKKFVNGELEIHEIDSTHLGMFDEPDVQILAEKLSQCIEKLS